jgi:hypothetical protein
MYSGGVRLSRRCLSGYVESHSGDPFLRSQKKAHDRGDRGLWESGIPRASILDVVPIRLLSMLLNIRMVGLLSSRALLRSGDDPVLELVVQGAVKIEGRAEHCGLRKGSRSETIRNYSALNARVVQA